MHGRGGAMGLRAAIPLLLLGLAAAPLAAHANNGHFEIVTLSNRADLVSGGDALLEVRVPKSVSLSQVRLKLNGRDVTDDFKADSRHRALRGLVTGLVEGRNDFVAEERGHGGKEAKLVITNHPIGGPVLSGAQVVPFFCATPVPQPATPISPATNASGLTTDAFDAQCNIMAEYKLYYKTTTPGCSFAIPDPSPSVNFLSTNPPTSA